MEEIDLEYESARYCAYCGKELLPERKEPYRYSRSTGEPVYTYTKYCPLWWELDGLQRLSHDNLTRYESVQ